MQSALSAFDFYLSRNLRNYTMTNSLPFQTHENRARGNRKTLKWLETVTKSNFRNLKLKIHEELLSKILDFLAKSQSQKSLTKR